MRKLMKKTELNRIERAQGEESKCQWFVGHVESLLCLVSPRKAGDDFMKFRRQCQQSD